MAKFNEVQKKRAQTIACKRVLHEHPSTRKLKTKPQPLFGKHKHKLLKKWRRD